MAFRLGAPRDLCTFTAFKLWILSLREDPDSSERPACPEVCLGRLYRNPHVQNYSLV